MSPALQPACLAIGETLEQHTPWITRRGRGADCQQKLPKGCNGSATAGKIHNEYGADVMKVLGGGTAIWPPVLLRLQTAESHISSA